MEDVNVFIELNKFNKVKFYDQKHQYFIKGKQYLSVTGFIHKFVKEFNRDEQSKKYFEKHKDEEGFLEKFPDVEAVLYSWDYKNWHAVFEGSTLHNYGENFLHNKILPYPTICERGKIKFSEIESTYKKMESHFHNFYRDFVEGGRLVPIKSEVVMGSELLGLCGMCDHIFWSTKKQCLVIFDWKTNTKLNMKSEYGEKMMHCLSHLDKCEFNTYSIEIETYKKILVTETNLRFPCSNFIVWFNEENDNYKLIECRDMRKEVDDMFRFKEAHPDIFSVGAKKKETVGI